MFLSSLEDFDYQPHVVDGELERGSVVTQTRIVWASSVGVACVPIGFVSDLASLPWYTALLFKKLGKHQRAAILHDWLYRNKIENKNWADEQFKLAMIEDKVKWWRRELILVALKFAGHKAWLFPKEVLIV